MVADDTLEEDENILEHEKIRRLFCLITSLTPEIVDEDKDKLSYSTVNSAKAPLDLNEGKNEGESKNI